MCSPDSLLTECKNMTVECITKHCFYRFLNKALCKSMTAEKDKAKKWGGLHVWSLESSPALRSSFELQCETSVLIQGNTSIQHDHQCEGRILACPFFRENTETCRAWGQGWKVHFPICGWRKRGQSLSTQKAQVNNCPLGTCTLIHDFWIMKEPENKAESHRMDRHAPLKFPQKQY